MASGGGTRPTADDANVSSKFDSKGLEIKTKSIEQTLVPLVTQITTLVNHKEKSRRSEKTCRAIERVGQAVHLAVERFVAVGETIAADNNDIRDEMAAACREARLAGSNIAKLTDVTYDASGQMTSPADKSNMVRAARGLLSAITRVLLLADKIVIKQISQARNRVTESLDRIEKTRSFTEFVQCFSQFGKEMVELAHQTGDRQNDLKDERAKSKMAAARSVLEKSTTMLLTSCKTCLRHPECEPAKKTRDSVFTNMRKALASVDDIISDRYDNKRLSSHSSPNGITSWPNMHSIMQELHDLVETSKVTLADEPTRAKMRLAMDLLTDTTQDFTDSAYTSHEHRERILTLCERAKTNLIALAEHGRTMDKRPSDRQEDELEVLVVKMIKSISDLRKQLQHTALDHASEVFKVGEDHTTLHKLKDAANSGQVDVVQQLTVRFHDYADQIREVCRLLGHVSTLAPLTITSDHAESNISMLDSQLTGAAITLAMNHNSKIAKENLDVFIDAWECQVNDLSLLVKEVNDCCLGRGNNKQVYLSLPRPGKHGTTAKAAKPVKLDAQEQAKIAKVGLEVKLLTSEVDAETEKWEDQNNEIVKRTKNMSSMAYAMYMFTRGEGSLKTTLDLFKQAEYFAEEGNKLFRSVKEFTVQVPDCPQRNDLLAYLEQIPSACQQLNFITKTPCAGKASTFNKVDSTIQETKNLLLCIVRLVPICYSLSSKYNVTTPNSPIARWRRPPPMMDLHSNSSDMDSPMSQSSGFLSDGSVMRNTLPQKSLHRMNSFDRL
ncbi:alpha-catulin-like isoform X1 [Diadema setosum]|uniref:alpha-catulin-like isoform X1 n=1 Tax=Diadema setosum TaxID=31175 RepID=UPI003B3B2BD3